MPSDPKNEHTYTSLVRAASYATNNAISTGFDTRGYSGSLAVLVDIGVKTAGDNDGAITALLQAAANNTSSEATNVGTLNVATTNNTAATGIMQFDPRGSYRYIFIRRVIAGTNSPAYPMSATVIGTKQVQ